MKDTQWKIPAFSRLFWGVPILALVLINAIWLLPSLRDSAQANSRFRLEVARRAADNMRMFLDVKAQALAHTADRLRFDREHQKAHLERLLKEHREFNSIGILDEQGREVARVSRFDIVLPEDLQHSSGSITYEAASAAGVLYGNVQRTTLLEPVMTLAVPLVFQEGNERGVLVGELNLRQLSSSINRFRFGATGKVYVVDEKATLIIDPDISLVLRNPDLRSRPVVQAPQKEIARARYAREDGVWVEASSVFLSALGWQVIAEHSTVEADIPRNRILALAFLSGGLGVLLFLLLVANNAKLLRLNQRLAEQNRESDETAKVLVRKDRALMRANQELMQLAQDLDQGGKLLVRRDLELTRSNERLRDLDALKSQFVSVTAHQLRTPLAGIKWTLYALLEGKVGKLNLQQKKFSNDAYAATMRLIELVNDLLDVARLEEGRFGFKKKRQALVPVVKKVFENFERAAREKGIAFSLVLPKSTVLLLDFDEERIRIVLENLMDNAIKYTPPGGSVAVTLRKDKEAVRIEVADTGIGMPEDQAQKVFTKFFRAENAQLLQTSGTGLGLYLAKNIVEHHGGSMFFTTKENKGSVFTFVLPIPKT